MKVIFLWFDLFLYLLLINLNDQKAFSESEVWGKGVVWRMYFINWVRFEVERLELMEISFKLYWESYLISPWQWSLLV